MLLLLGRSCNLFALAGDVNGLVQMRHSHESLQQGLDQAARPLDQQLQPARQPCLLGTRAPKFTRRAVEGFDDGGGGNREGVSGLSQTFVNHPSEGWESLVLSFERTLVTS